MKRRAKKPGQAQASNSQPTAELLAGNLAPKYKLRLYVAGNNLGSFRAIENTERFCHQHLHDRAELEIVDLYQQPAIARADRIVAAPCLVKLYPLPQRRFIGDMSDTRKMLLGLGLKIAKAATGSDGNKI